MMRNRCTLYKGSIPPSRPRYSPPLPFLSLAREIRDEIYGLALVSTTPIVVWKGTWEMEAINYLASLPYTFLSPEEWATPTPNQWTTINWRPVDKDTTSTSLQSLSLNILFCNNIVSEEAAQVFYKKNTFSFLGEHNWDPIISWCGFG